MIVPIQGRQDVFLDDEHSQYYSITFDGHDAIWGDMFEGQMNDLLWEHMFLLYDLRAYFVFCYGLFHRHAIRWRLRRCFGADALCKQTVTFCSDSSIRCTSLHQPAADGPLAVLPKKRILCAVLSGHFLMILVSRSAAPRTDLSAPESLYKARISLKDSICISVAPFRSSDWESLLTQVKAMDIPILTSSISTRLS